MKEMLGKAQELEPGNKLLRWPAYYGRDCIITSPKYTNPTTTRYQTTVRSSHSICAVGWFCTRQAQLTHTMRSNAGSLASPTTAQLAHLEARSLEPFDLAVVLPLSSQWLAPSSAFLFRLTRECCCWCASELFIPLFFMKSDLMRQKETPNFKFLSSVLLHRSLHPSR